MELNGRKVIGIVVGGVNNQDCPDFSDAYFEHAVYADSNEPLEDSELNALERAYPGVVNELAFKRYTEVMDIIS